MEQPENGYFALIRSPIDIIVASLFPTYYQNNTKPRLSSSQRNNHKEPIGSRSPAETSRKQSKNSRDQGYSPLALLGIPYKRPARAVKTTVNQSATPPITRDQETRPNPRDLRPREDQSAPSESSISKGLQRRALRVETGLIQVGQVFQPAGAGDFPVACYRLG